MKPPSNEPRLYDRPFLLAFLSQTLFVLANTLVAHYARWVAFLGGDVEQVGWVLSAGAVVAIALRPWMGQWINRLGARNTWALGYLIFAVSSLGNLLLTDLNFLIYALRTGLVLGAAFVFASSLTYVTQIAPVRRRTEAIGVLGAGGFVGMLMGPVLGDLILGPAGRERVDFVFLFVAASLAALVPMVLLLFLHRPNVALSTSRVRLSGFVRDVTRHWPGTILLVNLVFGLCMTVPFGFLYKFIDDSHILMPSMSPVGLFFLGYAGWGITVRLWLRRVPDRVGRRKVLLAGLLFMGSGMCCFPLVDSAHPWMLIVPGLVCGTGHALMFHTMTALALEPFPDEVRGSGSALSLMMLDLGTIAGAPLLGIIAKHSGYAWMYMTIGGTCLLVSCVYALSSVPVWRRRWRKRVVRRTRRDARRRDEPTEVVMTPPNSLSAWGDD